MTHEELLARLAAPPLERHRAALEPLIRNALCVTTRPSEDEDALPLGSTKLGGLPDLPPGTRWPIRAGVALEFVAQFNLADLAPLDTDRCLPRSGRLYFFFDGALTDYDKGEAPDRCRVLYVPKAAAKLQRREPPEGKEVRVYRPCRAELEVAPTLPAPCELDDGFFPAIHSVPFEPSERDAYKELREALMRPRTWLLGEPTAIQGEELRLQVARKLYPGRFEYKDYEWTNRNQLLKVMRQQRLLFQVDTDRNTDFCWGDTGIVYFWIRDADLRARRFDRVTAVMQSC